MCLQGIKKKNGSFVLSDPALLTAPGARNGTNMGQPAIDNFINAHTCGALCKALLDQLSCRSCTTLPYLPDLNVLP